MAAYVFTRRYVFAACRLLIMPHDIFSIFLRFTCFALRCALLPPRERADLPASRRRRDGARSSFTRAACRYAQRAASALMTLMAPATPLYADDSSRCCR